jgi:hypothetical protein
VCQGNSFYFDAWSLPFRVGVLGQDSKSLMNLMKQMGGEAVGDAVLVVPSNALCYETMSERDQFQITAITDVVEWTLTPGTRVKLPPNAVPVAAIVRTSDGLSTVPTSFPTPDADGKITVAVATTLSFKVSRLYELLLDLSKVRHFGENMPKKVSLKRLDWTTR